MTLMQKTVRVCTSDLTLNLALRLLLIQAQSSAPSKSAKAQRRIFPFISSMYSSSAAAMVQQRCATEVCSRGAAKPLHSSAGVWWQQHHQVTVCRVGCKAVVCLLAWQQLWCSDDSAKAMQESSGVETCPHSSADCAGWQQCSRATVPAEGVVAASIQG